MLPSRALSIPAFISMFSSAQPQLDQIPPVVTDRLSELPDGRLLYRLKRRWRDGTTKVIYEPLEFMEKLAALVPPPRFNLVRYSGVLASSSRLRRRIIPADPEKSAAESPACTHAKKPALSVDKSNTPRGLHERRYAWAELLKRVYAVDALKCDRCGGKMRILCAIHPPDAIEKILDCLGIPSKPPPLSPAELESDRE
jgi:hypothetical protein